MPPCVQQEVCSHLNRFLSGSEELVGGSGRVELAALCPTGAIEGEVLSKYRFVLALFFSLARGAQSVFLGKRPSRPAGEERKYWLEGVPLLASALAVAVPHERRGGWERGLLRRPCSAVARCCGGVSREGAAEGIL
jgi:hypothetical protein